MNIDIASLIGSILAVTVSVGFAVTFKISLNKKIIEFNNTVNNTIKDFKAEVNHKFELLDMRLTNIETKINVTNEKK